MDGNKSDDSFYDSDQDEQMAAASTQSLFDPCSPYTPVRPKQQPPSLTLSGRRLSSTVCAKATQSVQEHLLTQLSPSSVPPPTTPITSFVRASCYYEEAKNRKCVVSEEELEKQHEGGKEQQPECSESVDKRTLYERMEEQRDKKQLEDDETHALKDQFRAIDEAESGILTQVERAKAEQEPLQLSQQHSTGATAEQQQHALLEKPENATTAASSGISRQAALITSLVRKRPLSTDTEPKSARVEVPSPPSSSDSDKRNANESSSKTSGGPPPKQRHESHCQIIGVLPGLPNYTDSSEIPLIFD
ncbi:hypothetical protein niasHT_038458 [Heterodera trifolii]|uniref:FAM192A/Fyv6 N-terminal domain-containing protein n=1 Tax=Heterodera trifolii TaxID=157864 RepID=A0ABD2ITD0_9BILA